MVTIRCRKKRKVAAALLGLMACVLIRRRRRRLHELEEEQRKRTKKKECVGERLDLGPGHTKKDAAELPLWRPASNRPKRGARSHQKIGHRLVDLLLR